MCFVTLTENLCQNNTNTICKKVSHELAEELDLVEPTITGE